MPRSPFRGVRKGLKGAAAQQYHGRFDFAAIGACVDLIAPMDYDLTGSAPDGKAAAANSPYGVANLAGNVHEWVFDVYDPNYYGTPDSLGPDPQGATGALDDDRVMRGRSFMSGAGTPATLRISSAAREEGRDSARPRIAREDSFGP